MLAAVFGWLERVSVALATLVVATAPFFQSVMRVVGIDPMRKPTEHAIKYDHHGTHDEEDEEFCSSHRFGMPILIAMFVFLPGVKLLVLAQEDGVIARCSGENNAKIKNS